MDQHERRILQPLGCVLPRRAEGADLGVFLLSGGKLNHCPVVEKRITLREFFEHYRTHLPEGAKEANTRYTENIHLAHLERLIGADTAVKSITTDVLHTGNRAALGYTITRYQVLRPR